MTRRAPALMHSISLDQDWWFAGVYEPGTALPTQAGSTWSRVDLPHCVVALSWHGWDPCGWEYEWLYYRRVQLPAGIADARVLIDFDGVFTLTGVDGIERWSPSWPALYDL